MQDDYYAEDIRHFTIYIVNPKKVSSHCFCVSFLQLATPPIERFNPDSRALACRCSQPIEQYAYSQTTRVSDAICKTTVGAAKARPPPLFLYERGRT